jgi:NAD(P)H-dependent FMN reductase
MINIAIIVGSTRPGRKALAVAQWIYGFAKQRQDARFEIVDIQDFDLPLLDEPEAPPRHHQRGSATRISISQIKPSGM